MRRRVLAPLCFLSYSVANWTPKVNVLNLANQDDELIGFEGGFTDGVGKFGYFVPHHVGVNSGRLVRVSLDDFGSVEVLDLKATDPSLQGFKGGFAEGQYGFLVPHFNGDEQPSGKVVRVDLHDFTTSGIRILDLSMSDYDLRGFEGGVSDGVYGYLAPHWHFAAKGKVPRISLLDFTGANVTVLDLTATDPDLRGFDGAFVSGDHVYFVPRYNGVAFGKTARVDRRDFATVEVLDLSMTNSDLKGFSGGFSDGTYGYYVPRWNGKASGKIARVELETFGHIDAHVEALDVSVLDPALIGFSGGFAVGDYGYFVPRWSGEHPLGKFVRVDLRSFHGSAWNNSVVLDLPSIDGDLRGFSGGFTDDAFAYLVPCYNGDYFGKVVRIDLRPEPTILALIIDLIAIVAGLLAAGIMPLIMVKRVQAITSDEQLQDSRTDLIQAEANES